MNFEELYVRANCRSIGGQNRNNAQPTIKALEQSKPCSRANQLQGLITGIRATYTGVRPDA